MIEKFLPDLVILAAVIFAAVAWLKQLGVQGRNLTVSAFAFGLVLWHEVSISHVTTKTQEYVSVAMTWIDFVGSLAAGIADMILRQTLLSSYNVPPALAQFLIYGLPLIMAANVGAVLMYLSNDSEVQLDRAKKQLRFEIYHQAMRELGDNSGQIAEGMKKDIYRQLRDDVTGKVAKQFMRASPTELPVMQQPLPVNVPVIQPLPLNGNNHYNSDTVAINNTTPVTDQVTGEREAVTQGAQPEEIINPTSRRSNNRKPPSN